MITQMAVQSVAQGDDPGRAVPTPPGPLAGLRVLELSSYVAAPLAGKALAQLGADVIRIDPRGGAADRQRWPLAPSGTSLFWTGLNMGKRSITVDFAAPVGRDIIHRLLAACPPGTAVVITNAIGRPWLSAEALQAHAPDLIHVHIEGRADGSAAVDYTINAETGLPLVTGPEGLDGPVNHVLPAWDLTCGLYAALAVSAAAARRASTGQGARLRIALADVALSLTASLGHIAEAHLHGIERPRVGNHLYGTFARDFPSADGARVMVAAVTARQWRELLQITGSSTAVLAVGDVLKADFDDEAQRYQHREVLAALLAPWFAEHSIADVEAALTASTIPWGRYRTFRDVAADAASGALPIFEGLEQPGVGWHPAAGSPVIEDGYRRPPAPAPVLGADTSSILADLGWDADMIEAFRVNGIAGVGERP